MGGDIKTNGFASIVTGIDLEDDGNPREGYGNRTADSLQESRVGLQWTADLEDGMRFVAQAVAKGDASTGYATNFDWAYFDFNIGESGKLKVGRVRIPFYKYSDYLDVGYAYHWIAPPPAMYSINFSNLDGISYQHNYEMGGMEQALNIVVGRYQGVLPAIGPANMENFFAVNWQASMGEHEFSAAYAQTDLYVDAGLSVPDSTGFAVTDVATGSITTSDILADGDFASFVGVGYKGTFGDISVYSEFNTVTVKDSIFAEDDTGGYMGVSYAMEDYTYHVTYEISEVTAAKYSSALAQAISNGIGNEGDSTAFTFGVRKDVGISSAVKVDLTSYTEDKYQNPGDPAKTELTALILKVAVETMF